LRLVAIKDTHLRGKFFLAGRNSKTGSNGALMIDISQIGAAFK
jgi:hypothetical protein